LAAAGFDTVLLAALSAMTVNTDRRDARGIAQLEAVVPTAKRRRPVDQRRQAAGVKS
jgi:hypothetical protein